VTNPRDDILVFSHFPLRNTGVVSWRALVLTMMHAYVRRRGPHNKGSVHGHTILLAHDPIFQLLRFVHATTVRTRLCYAHPGTTRNC
jgi:hypothetical protein